MAGEAYPNVNMAMQNYEVMVPELVHGQYNSGGVGIYALDIEGDGSRYKPEQTWEKIKPEGSRGSNNAVTRDAATLPAGTYRPRYGTMDRRMRQALGAPYASSTLTDGRLYNDYRLPERGAAQDSETWTAFYGVQNDCYELRQAFIKSIGYSSARSGSMTGTLDVGACWVDRGQTMPAITAQTEVQALIATNAGGPVTVNHTLGGTGNFVVTPGDSAATVQANARTGGVTGATVAGTSTAATAGTAEVQTLALSNVAAGPVYLTVTPLTGSAQTVSFQAQSATAAADLQAALQSIFGIGLVTVSGTLASSSGTLYSGTLTITFSATLGNVTQITYAAGQTGVVPGTTTQGVASTNAAVNLQFTFAGQPNTNVPTFTLTGTYASSYNVQVATQGSDGTGYTTDESPYIHVDHRRVYRAASITDLLTIDFNNLPSDTSAGDAHLITTAESSGFTLSDLADYYYVEDGRKFPAGRVVLEGALSFDVTVAKSSVAGSDCQVLYDSELGCSSTKLWLVMVDRCGDYEVRCHFKGSRDAAADPAVSQNVLQEKFTFDRAIDMAAYNQGYGSCWVRVIRPAGTPAI